jgi:hypothetical protein
MGAPRRVGAAVLKAVLRMAPRSSREWAGAMLRELDFVRGDWAALLWALGGVGAVLRHAGRNWREWLGKNRNGEEERVKSMGKRAIGVAAGVIGALALTGCAFGLLRIMDLVFPALHIANTEWTHWLAMIWIPEAIFIAAGILLWRKRGPVAAGILLTACAIGLHFVIHIVSMRHF